MYDDEISCKLLSFSMNVFVIVGTKIVFILTGVTSKSFYIDNKET